MSLTYIKDLDGTWHEVLASTMIIICIIIIIMNMQEALRLIFMELPGTLKMALCHVALDETLHDKHVSSFPDCMSHSQVWCPFAPQG